MSSDDVARTLVTRLASVERELARRRALALHHASGRPARLMWHGAGECVALLARHGELTASVVAEVMQQGGAFVLPRLDGCDEAALRATRGQWMRELAALARGEAVTVSALPTADAGEVGPVEAGQSASVERGDDEVEALREPTRLRALDEVRVARRLELLITRAFDERTMSLEPPVDGEGEETPGAEVRGWYEVATRDDGGLALWLCCAPCDGFAPFVKTLAVKGLGADRAVRRENLARVGARLAVGTPGAVVTWSTGDVDDDATYAALLSSMTPEGLVSERPTIFRGDVEGPTQRLAGATLSPGRRYAVLVPPSLTLALDRGVTTLDEGWRLWSVEIPAAPDATLVALLATVGLPVAAQVLCAQWVLTPPARWDTTPRGQRFPVFTTEAPPVVRVSASKPRNDLVVFLHGNGHLERLELATTTRAELALEGLAAGRYLLEVTAADLALSPERLVFVIEDAARGRWPTEMPAVLLGGRTLRGGDVIEENLAALGGMLAWSIHAPPAATVRVRWDGALRWDSGALCADESGEVPTAVVIARTRSLREAAPVGAMTINLGESGTVVLRHVQRIDHALATARDGLRRSLDAAALLAAQGSFDASLALAMWAYPAGAALGYGVRELPMAARRVAPELCAAIMEDVLEEGGAYRVQASALLVLVRSDASLRGREEGSVRLALEALCGALGLTRAIVSDGRRWWSLDVRRSAAPLADSLEGIIHEDEGLEGFLVRYGAWR